MPFDPFRGYVQGDPASLPDVERRQKLAEMLASNRVDNAGPLGALATALAGTASAYESGQAAQEAQGGLTSAQQALAKALGGGYEGIKADPGEFANAVGDPFLPAHSAEAATDFAQQQAIANRPVPLSSFDTSILNPSTGAITPIAADGGSGTIDSIVQGIESGKLPPNFTGMSRPVAAAVQAQLAKDGFDATGAQIDFKGDSHAAVTANGSPQLRLRQVEETADQSLGLIKSIGDQWQALGKGNSQFPILNKANFEAALQGTYGQQAQSIATQLKAQMADVVSELATIYRGGNAPTAEAFAQAQTQLDTAWSGGTLDDMLANIKKNIEIRRNATSQAPMQVPDASPGGYTVLGVE